MGFIKLISREWKDEQSDRKRVMTETGSVFFVPFSPHGTEKLGPELELKVVGQLIKQSVRKQPASAFGCDSQGSKIPALIL